MREKREPRQRRDKLIEFTEGLARLLSPFENPLLWVRVAPSAFLSCLPTPTPGVPCLTIFLSGTILSLSQVASRQEASGQDSAERDWVHQSCLGTHSEILPEWSEWLLLSWERHRRQSLNEHWLRKYVVLGNIYTSFFFFNSSELT